MTEVIGTYVDRLCTVEMRPRWGNLPRGVIHRLYERAVEEQHEPLTMLAAKFLVKRVRPKDYIFIVTGGGGLPFHPKGEVDGPLGAAALARGLGIGLGAKPVLIGEAIIRDPQIAACEAGGVSMLGRDIMESRAHAGMFEEFPLGDDEGRKRAKSLLDEYRPSAVITIEKLGPNEKGEFHSVTGFNVSNQYVARAHHLVDEARRRDVLTVGVGDGGNEIGFGLIKDAVRAIMPFGAVCQCPCRSGNATVTKTDVLVVSAVSNWGAYGIEACLSVLLEKPSVLQDAETTARMLDACVRAGAMDGVYATQTLHDDGIPYNVHMSLITMLECLVSKGLEKLERSY